jgi:hypothetical protein
MEVKPAKGLKVVVGAAREAIFGEESVEVKKVAFANDSSRVGTLTGTVLAGYCEVEMPSLDGKKHWYPVDDLRGENGEQVVEEPVAVEIPQDDEPGEEEPEEE